MKKSGSESVGPELSRQQSKGTELLAKVHTKASIFIMDTPGHFPSQLSLAGEFSEQGFETLVLINNGILTEFLNFMAGKGYVAPVLPKPSKQSMLKRFMPTREKVLSMGNTWNFLKIPRLEQGEAKIKEAQIQNLDYGSTWRRIQNSNQNSLLVWPELNFFYGHLSIFRLLTKAKIPQAIYTYSLVSEEEWQVAFAKNVARTRDGLANRIIDLAFPAWTRFSDGKKIRLPLQFPIAAKLAAYHTYNPWLAGANMSIPIFTPDSFTFRYLQKAGYDSGHLHMGGMVGGEILIRTRQSSLNQKRKSKDRKPLVLVALPPDQTSDLSGQEFKTLIRSTILEPTSLLTEVANVQFVLHPRLETKAKTWLESLGLNIARGQLPLLIAGSDLYVACASATLRLAESLGIPAINYDVYNLGYGDFDDATSVHFADRPDTFFSLANDLLQMNPEQTLDTNLMKSPAKSIVAFTHDP